MISTDTGSSSDISRDPAMVEASLIEAIFLLTGSTFSRSVFGGTEKFGVTLFYIIELSMLLYFN